MGFINQLITSYNWGGHHLVWFLWNNTEIMQEFIWDIMGHMTNLISY